MWWTESASGRMAVKPSEREDGCVMLYAELQWIIALRRNQMDEGGRRDAVSHCQTVQQDQELSD